MALVLVELVVFAFELALPRYGMTLRGFWAKGGAVPYELVHRQDVPPRDLLPLWAAPATSLFVPGVWPPFLFDLLYLWLFGTCVEDRLGRLRFLVLFLVSGLAAVVVQAAAAGGSTAPVLGPGGAVAGLVGAYLVVRPRVRTLELGVAPAVVRLPASVLAGLWFVLLAVEGVVALRLPVAGVAVVARAGGLVAGALLAAALAGRPRGARVVRRA